MRGLLERRDEGAVAVDGHTDNSLSARSSILATSGAVSGVVSGADPEAATCSISLESKNQTQRWAKTTSKSIKLPKQAESTMSSPDMQWAEAAHIMRHRA